METKPSSGAVRIREVGPRDGLQNIPEQLTVESKVSLINSLALSGVQRMEVTSFVRPDLVPQLADGPQLLERLRLPSSIELSVLVPNPKGLDNAMRYRHRFHRIALFFSASETHNQKNVNSSVEDSLRMIESMVPEINGAGLGSTVIIGTAFGCPYEGRVNSSLVLRYAERLAAAGVSEIGFGDTTGMSNPIQVQHFFDTALTHLGGLELTAHFHNTRGQGLANAYAAWTAGCTSFEASFGELGGCPVPPGSTGNIATEDLVNMFNEMGLRTGISVPAVIGAASEAQKLLGRKLTSHCLVAGEVSWPGDGK